MSSAGLAMGLLLHRSLGIDGTAHAHHRGTQSEFCCLRSSAYLSKNTTRDRTKN